MKFCVEGFEVAGWRSQVPFLPLKGATDQLLGCGAFAEGAKHSFDELSPVVFGEADAFGGGKFDDTGPEC